VELCQELKNLRLRAVNESGCELFHSDFTVGQIQIEVRDEWNGVKLIPLSLDTNAPPVSVVAPGDFITLTATAQPEALEQSLSWVLGTMVVPDNSIEMTCTEAGALGVSLAIDDPQLEGWFRFVFGTMVVSVDVSDCEVGEEPHKTAITHPEGLQDLVEWSTNALGIDHYLVTGSIGYSSASDDYWVTPHVEPPEPPQPPQTPTISVIFTGSKESNLEFPEYVDSQVLGSHENQQWIGWAVEIKAVLPEENLDEWTLSQRVVTHTKWCIAGESGQFRQYVGVQEESPQFIEHTSDTIYALDTPGTFLGTILPYMSSGDSLDSTKNFITWVYKNDVKYEFKWYHKYRITSTEGGNFHVSQNAGPGYCFDFY